MADKAPPVMTIAVSSHVSGDPRGIYLPEGSSSQEPRSRSNSASSEALSMYSNNSSVSADRGAFELEEMVLVEGAIIVAVKRRASLFEKLTPRLTPRKMKESKENLASIKFNHSEKSIKSTAGWSWKECHLRLSCNRLHLHEFVSETASFKPKPRHTFKLSNVESISIQTKEDSGPCSVHAQRFRKIDGDAASGASRDIEMVESEFTRVDLIIRSTNGKAQRVLLGFVALEHQMQLEVTDGLTSAQGSTAHSHPHETLFIPPPLHSSLPPSLFLPPLTSSFVFVILFLSQ